MIPVSSLGGLGGIGSSMGGGGGGQTENLNNEATNTVGPVTSGGSTFGSQGVRGAFYNNAFSPGADLSKPTDIGSPSPYLGYVKWGILGVLVLFAGSALLIKAKG